MNIQNIPFEHIGNGQISISLEDFEDLMDRMAGDDAKANSINDELMPLELTRKIIEGENPIEVYLEYRNLTQTELAKVVGVTQTTISEIENGRKQGSIKTLKAIASALKVDLDDIV
jgi:DNA-binding XRE family transcriptional regulator